MKPKLKRFFSTVTSVSPFLLSFVLLIISIWYFFVHQHEPAYIDNAMGNLLATLLGLIGGIPIALWINRKNQEAEEQRKRLSQEQEALARKVLVLNRIKTELKYNLETLEHRERHIKNSDKNERFTSLTTDDIVEQPLKIELWDSLRYGGELEWIKDVDLLDNIASAYHQIKALAFVEHRFQVEEFSGSADHRWRSMTNIVRENIPKVRDTIDKALQRIDKAMTNSESE